MEVVKTPQLLLSNFEVYDLLKQEEKSVSRDKKPSRKATIAYETEQYLKSYTPSTVTSSVIVNRFLVAFRKYRLTKGEKLQILNHRPTSLVELQLLIEESEERFSEEIMNEMIEVVTGIVSEFGLDDQMNYSDVENQAEEETFH